MNRCMLSIVLMLLFAASCRADGKPSEVFDERTGATFIVVHDPLVFPVGQPGGWNAPMQFISVTALERDHVGVLSQYLVAYFWAQSLASDKPLTVRLDDREIHLPPLPEFPPELPDDRVMLAPGKGRVPRAAYAATREMFRLIAASRHVSLIVGEEGVGQEVERYDLMDGQKALAKFIQHLEGAGAP